MSRSPGKLSRSTSGARYARWNLALAFQEVFTAIVRLRSNRQQVTNSEAFRGQMKQALQRAEQEARSGGYKARTFVRFCLLSSLFLMSRSWAPGIQFLRTGRACLCKPNCSATKSLAK